MRTSAKLILILVLVAFGLSAALPLSLAASPSDGFLVKSDSPRAGWRDVGGGWYAVPATADKAALDADPVALAVEPNWIASIAETPNDPRRAEQYHLARVALYAAWDVTHADGQVVAVLDTGVDCQHPDLTGRCVGEPDDHGHGTHVAGIAAATVNNGVGGAGVAWGAAILSVKVLNSQGTGDFGTIVAGIRRAADAGATVINMSLGCVNCPSDAMQQAIAYAQGKGVVVVAAAGNHGTSAPSSPGIYALSVAATDDRDALAGFSGYGDWVDVSAPGASVLSTTRGGGYEAWNGTSMATPIVSGVAALLRAKCPACSVATIEAELKATGDPVATSRPVGKRINAQRALTGSAPTAVPGPTATPWPTSTPRPGTGDWGKQVVALVNQERAKAGLRALAWDDRLAKAAAVHNAAMDDCAKRTGGVGLPASASVEAGGECFTHQLPGEPSPDERARAAGWNGRYVLEDIGYGYTSPAAVVGGWMGSPGHRAAILSEQATEAGAHYLDGYGDGSSYLAMWWTLDIGVGGIPVSTPVIATPTATPRSQYPPMGWVFRVEARPSAGWAVWDALYAFCNRISVACSWYRSP